MRKTVLLILALVLLVATCGCHSFSNRGRVAAPMIGCANQMTLGVESVALTDSATVVDFVVHFHPGMWVSIAPSSAIIADGVAYEALAFSGIEPGSQVTMPDSGVIRFSATFPAIPADTRSFDFSEQVADGWKIWGVDLTGKLKHNVNIARVPREVVEADSRAEIPEPLIATTDSTTVDIHLLGYRPDMGDKLYWVINNLSGQSGFESPLTVDTLGNARARFNLTVPTEFIVIGLGPDAAITANATCMLSPGETAQLYIDTHVAGYRNMAIASEVDDYDYPPGYRPAYFKGRYPGHKQLFAGGLDLYSGNFGDYHMTGDEYTRYLISEYSKSKAWIDSTSTTASQRKYRTAMLNVYLIDAASDAFRTLGRNYYSRKGEWGTQIPVDSVPVKLSVDNIREIAALIDFNDTNLMLSNSVGSVSWNTQFWQNAGIDPGVLETVRLYNTAYVGAQSGFLDKSVSELRKRSVPLADAVEAFYRESKAKIDSYDKSMITPTPAVDSDKIFEDIVAPYKGKVVMVDLWNTWCGPCRKSIAVNEPEKDGDLASDDIVWIYIADESSPLATYLDMIKNIRGIHYRLTEEQISVLRSQFGVDGIPYYILVDRQGNAGGRPDLRDHSLYKQAILDRL